ncbi:MAG: hypothetical protein HZB76_03960 [Chlamydiae bacterium]|nr:hypothetical protein [Chlamydiota bacterium]
MKRKKILILLSILILGFFLFEKNLVSYTASSFVKFFAKKSLGQEFSFKSLRFNDGLIVFEDAKLGNQKGLNATSEKIFFKVHFNFSRPFFLIDMHLKKPSIEIKKDDLSKAFVKLPFSSLVQYAFNVEEGCISYNGQKIVFNYNQKEKKAEFEFLDLDLSKINDFNLKQAQIFKGKVSGSFSCVMQNNEFKNLKINATIKDLFASFNEYALGAKIDKLQIKGEIPKLDNQFSLLDFFIKPAFSNSKIKIDIDNLALLDKQNITLLDQVKGSFYYDQLIGQKVKLEGFVSKNHPFKASLNVYYPALWNEFTLFLDNKKIIAINSKEIEKDKWEAKMAFEEVDASCFSRFQEFCSNPLFKDLKVEKGFFSAFLNCKFDKNSIGKVFISDLKVKDLSIASTNNEITYLLDNLESKFAFDLSEEDFWQTFSAELKIFKSAIEINQKKISNINSEIQIRKGVFFPSLVSLSFEKIKADIELKGPVKEFNLLAKMKGFFTSLDESISCVVYCKRKESGFSFSGNFQALNAEDIVFGFDIDHLFSFLSFDIKQILPKMSGGWVRAENISLDKWSSLFKTTFPINGRASIAAFLKKDELFLQAKALDLEVKTPDFAFKIDKIGDLDSFLFEEGKCIEVVFQNGKWTGTSPAFKGYFYLPKLGLRFDLKEAKLQLENDIIDASLNLAESSKMQFKGNATFDLNKLKLNLQMEDFFGDLKDLQQFALHFGPFDKLPIEGKIQGSGMINFECLDEKSLIDWKIFANVKEGYLPINPNVQIKNMQFDFEFDSQNEEVNFSNVDGKFILKNKIYNIACPLLYKLGQKWEFDIRLANDLVDILRLCGDAKQEKGVFDFCFDKEKSLVFLEPFKTLDLKIKDGAVTDFKIEANPFSKNFFLQIEHLLDLGILPIKNLSFAPIFNIPMQGDFHYQICLDENKNIICNLSSGNFKIGSEVFDKIELIAKKQNDVWQIEKFKANDFDAQFLLQPQEGKLKISQCNLKKEESFFCNLEGEFLENSSFVAKLKDVKIDLKNTVSFFARFIDFPSQDISGYLSGDADFVIDLPSKDREFKFSSNWNLLTSHLEVQKTKINNKGLLHIGFSSDKGLQIQGLDLDLVKFFDHSSVDCQINQISYDLIAKKWRFKDVALKLPNLLFLKKLPSFASFSKYLTSLDLEQECKLYFNLEFLYDLSSIELWAPLVNLELFSAKRSFKDLCFKYQKDLFYLDFNYLSPSGYFEVANIFEFKDDVNVKTILYDNFKDSKPLTINWALSPNKSVQINDVQGSFFGIDATFQQDQNLKALFGSVKVDFNKTKKLFPKNVQELCQNFSLGKGYELKGELKIDFEQKNWIDFQGIISGKQFELFDYQFTTLFGKIAIKPDLIKIQSLKASDNGGFVTIGEVDLTKISNQWYLAIPKISVKELRPSLFQSLYPKPKAVEPLVIRELNLYDFKGKLSDPNSFSGRGYLKFINSFKRGYSIFEFPSEVFSRIVGLDIELLTPVRGKIEIEVKNAKFYLTKMKDAFSEKDRSKFFLSDNQSSYIDFNGQMHIDIAMKQFVLFKFTESFIISLRGTLDTPKCNLTKKRGIF